MKIPRNLYYILERESFRDPPWCQERPDKENPERLVEEDINQISASETSTLNLDDHRKSAIQFHRPSCPNGDHERLEEPIEFEPYAYHAGDRQPLSVSAANLIKGRGEDLEFMRIPVGKIKIPFGANSHTLTNYDFKRLRGRVETPVEMTWKRDFGDSDVLDAFNTHYPRDRRTTARKIELLQKCMIGFRLTDSGSKSKEEVKQAFSRLLHRRQVSVSESDGSFFWTRLGPPIHIYEGPVREGKTTTFMQIPSEESDAEDSYQIVEFRVMSAHEGDRKPISVAKQKALDNTGLMQVPMGYMAWNNRDLDYDARPASWKWTEESEEPVAWPWEDGWEDPIELTWKEGWCEGPYRSTLTAKRIFIRHYAERIYVVDTRGASEKHVADAIEDFAGIELRPSTDSCGQDYWWKVQYDAPMGEGGSLTTFNAGSRSGSKAPSLLDLYGGDKQRASEAYKNIN